MTRLTKKVEAIARGYETGEYSHPTRGIASMSASETQVGGGHYKDLAIQPSEFIHRNRLGWCEGNAIKYVTRHREKNGRQDIEKAIHYLELLLEWEYAD